MSPLAPDLRRRLEDIAKLYQADGRLAESAALVRAADSPLAEPEKTAADTQEAVAPGGAASISSEKDESWQPALKSYSLPAALVFVYVSLIALMLCPHWAPRDALIKPAEPFLGAFGLWQSWNVFSPNIREENFHITASVSYQDGSVALWEFPRQERFSGIEQMRAQRFRKWINDRIKNNTYDVVLPGAARYVARLHNDRANPPVSVALTVYSAPIPPPVPGQPVQLPPHWKQSVLFTYRVLPEDLK